MTTGEERIPRVVVQEGGLAAALRAADEAAREALLKPIAAKSKRQDVAVRRLREKGATALAAHNHWATVEAAAKRPAHTGPKLPLLDRGGGERQWRSRQRTAGKRRSLAKMRRERLQEVKARANIPAVATTSRGLEP